MLSRIDMLVPWQYYGIYTVLPYVTPAVALGATREGPKCCFGSTEVTKRQVGGEAGEKERKWEVAAAVLGPRSCIWAQACASSAGVMRSKLRARG